MKVWMLLLLSAFTCSSLMAQAPAEKTLLWEISGKNIKTPSYLYGTIHLMCPSDLKVEKTIADKFNSAKQLYLEVKTDDPAMMQQMMQGMKMNDTSTIKGMLGAAAFDSVSTIFKKTTGIPLEMLNTAKPILIISLVYPSLLGCTPDSWEKTFEDMAKTNSMPLKGLESLEDQMKVLDSIPYKEQAEMMLKMVYNLDSSKQVFLNMLNIYKAKDPAGLYNLVTSDKDFGNYESTMLVNRNRNWLPVIIKEAQQTPTFFAVGAAHLAGENGVINLLRKEGYTVKPVFY